MHSPVEKQHHTKNSYRNSTVFMVVCGDISKSKLVLGNVIQRLKIFNFRLHLQSLSRQVEICRARRVHSPVEKRHHTKNSYRKLIVFKVVCGDINKPKLILGTLIQRLINCNLPTTLAKPKSMLAVAKSSCPSNGASQIHGFAKSCRKTASWQNFVQGTNCFQGCPWRH